MPTTISDTRCPDLNCRMPQIDGVTHHTTKCAHNHRNVISHYERAAKEDKSKRRRETVKYYTSPKTLWDWTKEDTERWLAWISVAIIVGVFTWIYLIR